MSNILVTQTSAGGIDLRTLIDVEQLQRIQDNFAADTGLAMITVDAMGTPVTRASEFTALCQFLRQDPEIRRRCYNCDAHGGLQSAIEGRPFVYQCHVGLVDFSVSIMWGHQYLGAVLCGQVLLKKGQDDLRQIVGISALRSHPNVSELFDQVNVVELSKLQSAANEIVKLANETLGSTTLSLDAAAAGPYLGRLHAITHPVSNHVVAPLLAGRSKPLPLIPLRPSVRSRTLDASITARNIRDHNVAANLELLGRYLDDLVPRWSQKVKPIELADYEDLLIGIATGEAVQYGRDISQLVIRHRNQRRTSMNRYESQLYCERLLISAHNLLEPALDREERSITSLLNEIEKNPTSFLTLQKAAAYLMWSESHFARKFKARTGMSFIEYVTGKRLERAKLMLAHTTKPILRIATELGFQPLNYFSRTFKKQIGLTPTQYRQANERPHDE